MKKNLLLVGISFLAMTACKQEPQYRIEGTVTGGDTEETTVYLMDRNSSPEAIAIDSALLLNGAFTMQGRVERDDLYSLYIADKPVINLFLENAPVKVTIDRENPKSSRVSGSPLNDLYNTYTDALSGEFDSKMKAFRERAKADAEKKLTPEEREELGEEYGRIMEEQKAFQLKFLNENPNNLVSAYILRRISSQLPMDEVENQLNKFDTIVGKSYFVTEVRKEYDIQKRTSPGQPFTDIRLSDPEGNPIALSDFAGKGNYVLIDFWASWCGPCRAENPNVVALYKKYKGKGFEIVGVSLDRDKDAWLKGIEDDKITWPQMSDLKFWDSEGARLYGVRSIPSTVLLDKDGTILARGLRGKDLEDKVAELLDTKK